MEGSVASERFSSWQAGSQLSLAACRSARADMLISANPGCLFKQAALRVAETRKTTKRNWPSPWHRAGRQGLVNLCVKFPHFLAGNGIDHGYYNYRQRA
jgi:hypothetical protein